MNNYAQRISHDPHVRIAARDRLIAEANKYIGRKYQWGGNGPAFDCSGLVKKVAADAFGVDLPRTSQEQWSNGPGKTVATGKLMRGDLVFFGNGDATHVGIMISNDTMINAQSGAGKVQQANINHFGMNILGGRRLVHKG